MKIAEELTTVRSLSPRDEATVQVNLGRLQGLGQGMDFLIHSFEAKEVPKDVKAFGFQLAQPPEDEELSDEEDKQR